MPRFASLTLTLALFFFVGCAGVPKNGDVALVRPDSDKARAGNVYLLRGWIGIFSRGVDDLGAKLNESGVRATVYQADQWHELATAIEKKYAKSTQHEPLVLVGHSYGADNVVRISQYLREKNVNVDLLITLDPVTPPRVPVNVLKTVNLYQSNGIADALPFLRGVPLTPEKPSLALQNIDIRKDRRDLMAGHVDHFNIEKQPTIHSEVIRQVGVICVPRNAWAGRPAQQPASEKVPAGDHSATLVDKPLRASTVGQVQPAATGPGYAKGGH